MAVVKDVQRAEIKSITVELTGREALLVKTLCGLGTAHLSEGGVTQLKRKGLDPSPFMDVGGHVVVALAEAGV